MYFLLQRFKYIGILFTIFLCFLSSCSSDDDADNDMVNGTVVGPASCSTDAGDSAYSIEVDFFEYDIITATLPDQFKTEGINITFQMERSEEGIFICTANLFPEQFYKVTDVRLDDE
ncbi:hypothetical protein [Nonlabens ponticola]|uniref:Uncharacterized protein n=1 Tax=Nonlabens ponticola TaxID=2496866 RepID=A0A3S9MZM0_9FLAO|nr:hypothetical protein [Nonlabens ponticola]AZQ44513.1 hypothetical protein EJ995_09755 [Nonlabens ponticola]